MIQKIQPFFPLVLLIFHIIGVVLFLQSGTASNLTWLNLTLCGLLVILSESKSSKPLAIFALIFTGGFLIEWIGTSTGYLFGNYTYGSVLGTRLDGVSLIIGVNWYAIVLASANVIRKIKSPVFVQAILTGVLCVAMDYLIEPVAIKYGFWTWENEVIPIFNYVTWFVFAVLFAFVYLKVSKHWNRTAFWLYFIWLVFFAVLIFI